MEQQEKTTTAAGTFFTHTLPPIPEAVPPFYVRLYDQHIASITTNEADLVLADIGAFSREVAATFPFNTADPFQSNDALQGIMDLPLAAFATTTTNVAGAPDGWERRRQALRVYSQLFFQRAVTVVSAHMQHANVKSAAGFVYRAEIGGGSSYTCAEDGLYLHMWRSAAQARYFVSCLRGLQQCLFDLNIRSVRAPIVSVFLYRGLCFTVSAAVPLTGVAPPGITGPVSWGSADTPTGDSCAVARLDASLLAAALGGYFGGAAHVDGMMPPIESFALERALDGRLYVTSLQWRVANMALGSFDSLTSDTDDTSAAWLRPEAASQMDDAMRLQVRQEYCAVVAAAGGGLGRGGGRPSSLLKSTVSALLRQHATDTVVPRVAEAMHAAVAGAGDPGPGSSIVAPFFKDNTVTRLFHQHGLPMRFLYAVLNEAYVKVPAAEKRGGSKGFVYRGVKELLELEMVNRTVKNLIRLELRAATGEDPATHVQRVNRLYSSLASKKSSIWSEQVHTVLRRKYAVPPDYTVTLTATMLKFMVAFASSRLGCVYDKERNRFSGFTAIHQFTTIFALPARVQQCIPARDGRSVSAAVAGDDARAGSPALSSPGLRSNASAANLLAANAAASSPAAAKGGPVVGSEEQAIDPLLRRQCAEGCELSWQAIVLGLNGSLSSLFMIAPTTHSSAENVVVNPVGLADLLRVLTLLRLLGSPNFESRRSELYRAVCEATAGAPRSAFDSCIVLRHRLLALAETPAKVAEAELLFRDLEDVVGRLGKHVADDAFHIGRMQVYASKITGDIHGVVRGTKLFRHATWCDVALLSDYFTNLLHASAVLNVNSDTAALAEVYRLADRVVRRHDAAQRRAGFIAAVRKTSAALVASQAPSSCLGLRDAVEAGLRHHMDRFGPKDIQTTVMFAQAVYVAVASQLNRLNDQQLLEVRKFHYQVGSMSVQGADALRSMVLTEQYTASLAAMIQILRDLGDELMAVKAYTQAAAAVEQLDQKGQRIASVVGALRAGAAGRLQQAVKFVARVGRPASVFKRFFFEDTAYRQGLSFLELEARHALECDELFARRLESRGRVLAFESREWSRTLWFGSRHIYVVPPELLARASEAVSVEETAARQVNVDAPEAQSRAVLADMIYTFHKQCRRWIADREALEAIEAAQREATVLVHFTAAVPHLFLAAAEGTTRALLQSLERVAFGEIRGRYLVIAAYIQTNAQLEDSATLSRERVHRFVETRESLIAAEARERGVYTLEYALHHEAITLEWRAVMERIVAFTDHSLHVAELHGRTVVSVTEDAARMRLVVSFRDTNQQVRATIVLLRTLQEEEREARRIVGSQQVAAMQLWKAQLDQAVHRQMIADVGLRGLQDLHAALSRSRRVVSLHLDEELQRHSVESRESAERAALESAHAQDDEHMRASVVRRRALEQEELLSREHLTTELLTEASLMFRNAFISSARRAEQRRRERESLCDEERVARDELWHAAILSSVPAIEEAERMLVAAAAEAERHEITKALADPRTLAAVREQVERREAAIQETIDRLRRQREHDQGQLKALHSAERDARASLYVVLQDSLREHAYHWRTFLRGLQHITETEPLKRASVERSEEDARERLAAAASLRVTQPEPRRISETSPLRTLRRELLANRIASAHRESQMATALALLHKELEARRRRQLHDRVAAQHSHLPELRDAAIKAKAAARREQQATLDASITVSHVIQTGLLSCERAAHLLERDSSVERRTIREAEAAAARRRCREEMAEDAANLARLRRQEAPKRYCHPKGENHENAEQQRPHFTISQTSHADAPRTRAVMARRVKREKEILAAMRYLEAREEARTSPKQQPHHRAREEPRTNAVIRPEAHTPAREPRGRGCEVAKHDSQIEQKMPSCGLRVQETSTLPTAAPLLKGSNRPSPAPHDNILGAESQSLVASSQHCNRVDDSEQMVRLRHLNALKEQRRTESSMRLLRHVADEDGCVVKSPVKAPGSTRFLPPMQLQYTTELHRALQSL